MRENFNHQTAVIGGRAPLPARPKAPAGEERLGGRDADARRAEVAGDRSGAPSAPSPPPRTGREWRRVRARTGTGNSPNGMGWPTAGRASLARKPKAPARVSIRRDGREATKRRRRFPRGDFDLSGRDRRWRRRAPAWERARSPCRAKALGTPLPCPRARSRSARKPDARGSRAASPGLPAGRGRPRAALQALAGRTAPAAEPSRPRRWTTRARRCRKVDESA
jgi:hypothetical protein